MARNERRVWSTLQVEADPFNEKHLYVLQELLGSWIDDDAGNPSFYPTPDRDPILTRVLYAKMTPTGKLENVNQGSWEGRKNDE